MIVGFVAVGFVVSRFRHEPDTIGILNGVPLMVQKLLLLSDVGLSGSNIFIDTEVGHEVIHGMWLWCIFLKQGNPLVFQVFLSPLNALVSSFHISVFAEVGDEVINWVAWGRFFVAAAS